MTAVICVAIMAFAVGLILLHAWGLANFQERVGLRLLEMADARRKREAAAAKENEARCMRWAQGRIAA